MDIDHFNPVKFHCPATGSILHVTPNFGEQNWELIGKIQKS